MAKKALLVASVSFSGMSANKETASISIKIDRSELSVDQAEEYLCGLRLDAELRLGNGQKALPGMEGAAVDPVRSSFDVTGYSAKPGYFSFSAKTMAKSVDLSILGKYPGKDGRLHVFGVEEITTEDDAPGDGDEDANTIPGTASPLGKGEKDPVSALGLSPSLTEKIEAHGLRTVGELIQFINRDELWMRKIKGVGVNSVDKITDAVTDWHRKSNED